MLKPIEDWQQNVKFYVVSKYIMTVTGPDWTEICHIVLYLRDLCDRYFIIQLLVIICFRLTGDFTFCCQSSISINIYCALSEDEAYCESQYLFIVIFHERRHYIIESFRDLYFSTACTLGKSCHPLPTGSLLCSRRRNTPVKKIFPSSAPTGKSNQVPLDL